MPAETHRTIHDIAAVTRDLVNLSRVNDVEAFDIMLYHVLINLLMWSKLISHVKSRVLAFR